MSTMINTFGFVFGIVVGFFLFLSSVIALTQNPPETISATTCIIGAVFYTLFAVWCWRSEFGKKPNVK
jgi:Na+/H+ antiporter NhaC